jgi:hypothetical protein
LKLETESWNLDLHPSIALQLSISIFKARRCCPWSFSREPKAPITKNSEDIARGRKALQPPTAKKPPGAMAAPGGMCLKIRTWTANHQGIILM